MLVLLVDGDYLLSGCKPTTDADVRGAIERLESALATQLLAAAGAGGGGGESTSKAAHPPRIDTRIALFSSALIASLSESWRHNVISTLRKLRFQTTVLESVGGRPGSPIDAALCTKAILFAMMAPASANAVDGNSNKASSSTGGGRNVFCFVTPNAYLGSALDLITTRGCDTVFVVYDGDEVAEELLGYVSAALGPGIATMPKGAGVAFIPNTEAASAALAALQQEGKDLPLSVLQELRSMQKSLTTRQQPNNSSSGGGGVGSSGSVTASRISVGGATVMDESRRRVQREQALFAPPPPLPGVPSPFATEEKPKVVAIAHSGSGSNSIITSAIAVPHTNLNSGGSGGGRPSAPMDSSDEDDNDNDDDGPPARYEYHGDVDLDASNGNNYGGSAVTSVDLGAPADGPPVYSEERLLRTTDTSPQDVVASAAGHPPAGAPPASAYPLVNAPPAAVAGEPRVATSLPAGWALLYDRGSRRHYYAGWAKGGRGGGASIVRTWGHPLGPKMGDALDEVEMWYRHQQRLQHEQQQQPSAGQQMQSQLRPDMHATTISPSPSLDDRAAALQLPEHWEERVDPQSGKVYYANSLTKATTWVRPGRATTTTTGGGGGGAQQQQQPSAGAASNVWEMRLDSQGRQFYVNHALQQTSWTKPPGADIAPAPVAAAATTTQTPPQQWEAKLDPSSGQTYFVNHATKETSWTVPTT